MKIPSFGLFMAALEIKEEFILNKDEKLTNGGYGIADDPIYAYQK
jgi:hypothetical protein